MLMLLLLLLIVNPLLLLLLLLMLLMLNYDKLIDAADQFFAPAIDQLMLLISSLLSVPATRKE